MLREANRGEHTLACHTDYRAPKFAELSQRPRAAWMFYDPPSKLQLRASGSVTLHHCDELAGQRWEASATRSRACYQAASGPGAPIDPGAPQSTDVVQGFDQFVVVRCRLDRLDWLYLRGKGHWRAHFDWHENDWQGRWIAP